MPWGSWGGVPCQVHPGGYPGGGYPGQGGTLGGVPWPGGYPGWGGTLAGGVPWLGGTLARGYPGWGVPWLGGTQLGQHREYLLHGGRYASCVHAGRTFLSLECIHLSCLTILTVSHILYLFRHFSRLQRRIY